MICQMLPSQRDVNFVFCVGCRIVPFGAGVIFFSLLIQWGLLIFFL